MKCFKILFYLKRYKNKSNLFKQNDSQYDLINKIKKISKWSIDHDGNLKTFKQQLKDYHNQLLPSGTQLIISDNSNHLKYANANNYPIVINQSNIDKITVGKHHNINHSIIENLDCELKHSVLAMDSKTVLNARVIVLNQLGSNGNPIIATLHLNKQNTSVDVNELTSLYDKKQFQDFINSTYLSSKNIYINEKTEEWLIRNRLQLPTRFTTTSVTDNNITQSNKNVNLLPTNNMPICNDFMTLSDED